MSLNDVKYASAVIKVSRLVLVMFLASSVFL